MLNQRGCHPHEMNYIKQSCEPITKPYFGTMTVPNPEIPSPQQYGGKLEGDKWIPVMTKQLSAPKSVNKFVRCDCVKTNCLTDKCNCRRAELDCTDMCGCYDIEEICDNAERVKAVNMHTDEEDDELHAPSLKVITAPRRVSNVWWKLVPSSHTDDAETTLTVAYQICPRIHKVAGESRP